MGLSKRENPWAKRHLRTHTLYIMYTIIQGQQKRQKNKNTEMNMQHKPSIKSGSELKCSARSAVPVPLTRHLPYC